MDDGIDPHRRPSPRRGFHVHTYGGRVVGPLTAQEALDPSNWGSVQPSHESTEAPTEPPGSSRRRRPRRSGTRFQSQASSSSSPAPVFYPDGSVGVPTRPHGTMLFDPDRGVQGPFTPGEVIGYATTHGRRRRGSQHRRAEGSTRVRQSVLYSDRVRYSQPRRLAPAQEHVTSTIEVCSPGTILPTFEALSLSDQPLSIREKPEEIFNEMPEDFGQSAPYTYYPKGISRSMVLSHGCLIKIVSTEKQQKPDPEIDIEETLRLLKEYDAAQPKSFWQAVDEAKARERATLAALAIEWRAEGPREVPQQASVASYPQHRMPQHSMSHRAPRCEASKGETSQTGNEWMNKEVMLCFKKYIERSADLAGLVEYDLDELLHQCFNMESYDKVFHHYNFTVRMKMLNSVDWTVQLYFAEVKEIFMRKYYVCYPLEPNENGCCYACKSQGVNDLRHPAIDVFEMGSCDSPPCGLWYADE